MTPVEFKVVYILGFPRSGTTLLGNLLGETAQCAHVGELCHLWGRIATGRTRLGQRPLCGCGVPLATCPHWSLAMQLAGIDDPGQVEKERIACARSIRFRVGRGRAPRVKSHSAVAAYGETLHMTYEAAARVQGATVIVDSSKNPAFGATLARMPGVQGYWIHLVRDPRGVFYSRQRSRADHEEARAHLDWPILAMDAYRWGRDNRRAEAICAGVGSDRCVRIRYEDLVRRPRQTLETIGELIGEDFGSMSFLSPGHARFSANHTVLGNRSRFAQGTTALTEDLAWMRAVSPRDLRLSALVTTAPRRRYGYPTRPELSGSCSI